MMDDADILAGLTEEELAKLNQFRDLSGIDQLKSLQILRANDWNLEIALDLALEGTYNEDQTIYSSSELATSQSNNEETHIRHRHNEVTSSSTTSSASNNESISTNSNINNSNQQPATNTPTQSGGLQMVLWNATTWLLKLPFIIAINTFNTFYDFFSSFIRPTLNYDYTGTVERFINEFEEKYGSTNLPFLRSSYAQAIEKGKRDIRFVLIYVHSPAHRDTDRFCTNVLTSPQFSEFIINENMIFWACSVNYPDGYKAMQSLKPNTYPFIALIGLKEHRMTAMKRFEGYYELDQFLALLRSAASFNEYVLIAARLDREERNTTQVIRAQQDAAFEESLRVDQEKERKRQEELRKKAEEERLKLEAEQAQQKRLDQLVEMKKSLVELIPEEPELGHEESIRLLFKLPNGKRLERRFCKSHPVKYLYYFVFCNEPTLFNFKIRTNFPTRDLPGFSPSPDVDLDHEEMNIELAQCDLGNCIMLFVHDLDS